MDGITEENRVISTVKAVGESVIIYSVEKHGDSYAIEVSSTMLSEGRAYAKDIAQDRVTAENIKNLLADNLVSPLHIFDILDDLSAENCI